MGERIKQIPQRFLEFWNNYTSKQKTIIICVLAAVIFALAVLIAVFSKTKYTQLDRFETTADAAAAKNLLEENGIAVKASGDDATIISVDKKKISDARLLLGENGITSTAKDDYSFLFDNSMSTTDSERVLKAKITAQQKMEKDLKTMDGVKACSVTINIPDASTSIYKDEKEATVSIMLMTTDEFTRDVSGIASYAANTIGSTQENVRILDQTGKLLFSGADIAASGNATSSLEAKSQVELSVANRVRDLLISSGSYNDANVAPNLDVQLSEEEIHRIEYFSNTSDETKGPITSHYTYDAENVENLEGVPGTDSNGEEITDNFLQDGGNGNSTVAVDRVEHATSSEETTTRTPVGKVNMDNSSISVVLSRYVVYDEQDMEERGLLEDTTFAEFKAEHENPAASEVPEEMFTLVANATGIDVSRISIMAYEVPMFNEKGASAFTFERILQLILALLIVGLIIFVVVKGMKPVEVVEVEPELSVEALLATTKENQTLDDIEFSDKSATRTQIEKFVDENPEAVAALLRNWLNDDWE